MKQKKGVISFGEPKERITYSFPNSLCKTIYKNQPLEQKGFQTPQKDG
jgi:hypothetical protein